MVGQLDDSPGFPFLRFDSDAHAAFRSWLENLMSRLNAKSPEAMPETLVAHLSKYRKALPAIALLSELADNPNPKAVSLKSWQRAESWGEYLESHARRVYAPKVRPELVTAHKLAKHWKDLPQEFTTRDIYRHHWEGLADADAISIGLKVMEGCGWLVPETRQTGGRPSETWRKATLPEVANVPC